MHLLIVFIGSCTQTFRSPGMGYDLVGGLVTFSRSWGMWTPHIWDLPKNIWTKMRWSLWANSNSKSLFEVSALMVQWNMGLLNRVDQLHAFMVIFHWPMMMWGRVYHSMHVTKNVHVTHPFYGQKRRSLILTHKLPHYILQISLS